MSHLKPGFWFTNLKLFFQFYFGLIVLNLFAEYKRVIVAAHHNVNNRSVQNEGMRISFVPLVRCVKQCDINGRRRHPSRPFLPFCLYNHMKFHCVEYIPNKTHKKKKKGAEEGRKGGSNTAYRLYTFCVKFLSVSTTTVWELYFFFLPPCCLALITLCILIIFFFLLKISRNFQLTWIYCLILSTTDD